MIFVTTAHLEIPEYRLDEIIYCINNNANKECFSQIIIFLELKNIPPVPNLICTVDQIESLNINKKFSSLLDNSKINFKLIDSLPTFRSLFEYCNQLVNEICVVSNADIYFPDFSRLEKIQKLNFDNKFLVLTRYNIYDQISDKLRKEQTGIVLKVNGEKYRTQWTDGASIDSWIFKSPIDLDKANYDIELGKPECDGYMNYELSKNYQVSNPCLSIISIHNHSNYDSKKYNQVKYNGKVVTRKEWRAAQHTKGFRRKNIGFCVLDEQ